MENRPELSSSPREHNLFNEPILETVSTSVLNWKSFSKPLTWFPMSTRIASIMLAQQRTSNPNDSLKKNTVAMERQWIQTIPTYSHKGI